MPHSSYSFFGHVDFRGRTNDYIPIRLLLPCLFDGHQIGPRTRAYWALRAVHSKRNQNLEVLVLGGPVSTSPPMAPTFNDARCNARCKHGGPPAACSIMEHLNARHRREEDSVITALYPAESSHSRRLIRLSKIRMARNVRGPKQCRSDQW